MADYQIDELSLKIDIQGANKKNAENIRDIASAIRSLNKAVSNSGALNNLKAYSKNLQKLAGSIRSSFADIKSGTAAGSVTPKMTDVGGGRTNKKITDKLPTGGSNGTNIKEETQTLGSYRKQIEAVISAYNDELDGQQRVAQSIKYLNKEYNKQLALLTTLSSKGEDTQDVRERLDVVMQYRNEALAEAEAIKERARAAKQAIKEQEKLRKEQEKLANAGKKSTGVWSKFTKSIGRIAMYRAIRAALKSITQAMVEGVQNYAKYSDSANKAISNIRNSFQQVKDSFGVTLGSLLESLEPIITTISNGLVELANNVNMALAAMSGKDSYKKAIKRNEDYAKSLEKTNKLLSFDRFESLNNEEETKYEDVSLNDELPETANTMKDIFSEIKDIFGVLKDIWDTLEPILASILKPIFDLLEPILDLVESLLYVIQVIIDIVKPALDITLDLLNPIIQIIKNIIQQISGAIKIIGGLIKLLTGDFKGAWDSIKDGFRKMLNGMINMFINFINFLIECINTVIKPLDWLVGGIGKLMGKNWGLQIPRIPQVNIRAFAKGGVPEVGSMFYAGEAGAEIVSTSRSGQTGVANVEQISQAMLQALINYNAAQNGQSSGGDVYLDGRQVGQLVESSVYREGVRVGHFKRA